MFWYCFLLGLRSLAYAHHKAVQKWPKIAEPWKPDAWNKAVADNNAAVRGYFKSRFPDAAVDTYNRNDRSPLYPLRYTPRKGIPALMDNFPAYPGGSYRLDHCATDEVSVWFSLAGGYVSASEWDFDLAVPLSWYAKQGRQIGRAGRVTRVSFWPTPLLDDRTPLAVQMLRLRLFVDAMAMGRRKQAA